MSSIGDYNTIMSDRNIFNQIVYTPLSEALVLLEARQKDPILMAKIEELLKGDIPEILKNKMCGVLSRHIATPNHESRRFMSISSENNLFPVFFEFHDDKFTSNNPFKHSLAQICVQKKFDQKGDDCSEKITIIDFNKHNGKKFKNIKTFWMESLIDFHYNLFKLYGFKDNDYSLYDASEWFRNNGGNAISYYKNFLLLFVCSGILFENFLMKDLEGQFTRDIVLPTIDIIMQLTGVKPIIVPLEPLDLEIDNYWFHHLKEVKNNIKFKYI